MAGIISEGHLSRAFNVGITTSEFELLYDVTNTEDENEVYTLLRAAAPGSFFGLRLENIEAEPMGGGVWKGHARYIRPEDENEYTFDTGGGSKHITQALDTINSYALGGGAAPNFAGSIGVTDEKVEGVDVPDPKFEFTETHLFDPTFVSAGYKRLIFQLTGCMNDASFKGLAAGECLFVGAAGAKRGIAKWSITFRFSGSQNATGLTIGGITGIDKLGHDYAWIRYGNFVDAGHIVSRPVVVTVVRVIPRADFSTLGIGV
jgi:hypothetical protein